VVLETFQYSVETTLKLSVAWQQVAYNFLEVEMMCHSVTDAED
jgi:hypothetical protein